MHRVWAARLQHAWPISRTIYCHRTASCVPPERERERERERESRDGAAARFRKSVNKHFWEWESCTGFPRERTALELYLCSLSRLAGLRYFNKKYMALKHSTYFVYLVSSNTPAAKQDKRLTTYNMTLRRVRIMYIPPSRIQCHSKTSVFMELWLSPPTIKRI
jgi:hypothetical protein